MALLASISNANRILRITIAALPKLASTIWRMPANAADRNDWANA
jgi:hypothetical protein